MVIKNWCLLYVCTGDNYGVRGIMDGIHMLEKCLFEYAKMPFKKCLSNYFYVADIHTFAKKCLVMDPPCQYWLFLPAYI